LKLFPTEKSWRHGEDTDLLLGMTLRPIGRNMPTGTARGAFIY